MPHDIFHFHPHSHGHDAGRCLQQRTGLWTVALAASLALAKAVAAFVTGSTAILAAALDSLQDALISSAALFSLHYSAKPADDDHRHGHGKIEGIFAFGQSAFLCGSALFLALETVRHFIAPRPLDHHDVGIAVMLGSLAVTGLIIILQKRAMKKAPSLIIQSDHAHYTTDLVTHGGIAIVIALDAAFGWRFLDPLVGILAALYMGYSGIHVGRKAVDMLMDREAPEETRAMISAVIESHAGVKGFHDLRTRLSGDMVFVSVDIEVAAHLSLIEAHQITRDIEENILAKLPAADVMIHVDPEGDVHDARHRVAGVHT